MRATHSLVTITTSGTPRRGSWWAAACRRAGDGVRGARRTLLMPLGVCTALVAAVAPPLLVPAPVVVAATAYFVNATTGDDTFNCMSPTVQAGNKGPCKTIGAALKLAGDGDSISVAPGAYPERITIAKGVTLQGTGTGTHAIDGGDAGVVVTVNSAKPVTIRGVTIQNGNATGQNGNPMDGGGVNVAAGATLIMRAVVISNTAMNNGGGIYNAGTLTLEQGSFVGAIPPLIGKPPTPAPNAAGKDGGGIYSVGKITATETTISYNKAKGNGGGLDNLYAGNGKDATDISQLIRSKVQGNSATSGGGIYNTGALAVVGGKGTPGSGQVTRLTGAQAGGGSGAASTPTYGTANGPGLYCPFVIGADSAKTKNTDGNVAGSGDGGGIYTAKNATTILDDPTAKKADRPNQGICLHIKFNTATQSGGGIYNAGTVKNTSSLPIICYNNAQQGPGGGINNDKGATLELHFANVCGNYTDQTGGGINNAGTAKLVTILVTDNQSKGKGSGVKNNGGKIDVSASTVDKNLPVLTGKDVVNDPGPVTIEGSILGTCEGQIVSAGYNLVEDTAGCDFAPGSTDKTNVDAQLGPMQDNGGNIYTLALPETSPAVDAIPADACTDLDGNPEPTDERGYPRPDLLTGRCDMGSYEFQRGLDDSGGGGGGGLIIPPVICLTVTCTVTFVFTDTDQLFVVPADVMELTIDAFGAEGGPDGVSLTQPGLGGHVRETLNAQPGDRLIVDVGGQGGAGTGDGHGGFGGGAQGGMTAGLNGGGGGGASTVRHTGGLLVIAGGGGGGGTHDGGGSGGDGGGSVGATGGDAIFNPLGDAVTDGLGGTQAAGGTGGTSSSGDPSGGSGTSGWGGTGAGTAPDQGGGGGGGGGYFGGGGGGSDAVAVDDGQSGSGGGGGGSAFQAPGSKVLDDTDGVWPGNGLVIITFTNPSGSGCVGANCQAGATPELGSGALLTTILGPLGIALVLRYRRRRRAMRL